MGKTFIALGTIHILTAGRPSTALVMCPSHITTDGRTWSSLTIPRVRAFFNGGDAKEQRGIFEVKLSKDKTVYEGRNLTLAEMRRISRREWRERFSEPGVFHRRQG